MSQPSPPSDATIQACLLDLDAAMALRQAWRRDGLRLVLTNGCFDLLHPGHVRYLAAARRLGDRLLVALNDDGSTRGLKGPGRPVLPLADRAELLCALRSVDAVLPFGESTAVRLVQALAPDLYVKGGDYAASSRRPPEADAAEALGGEVRFLPFVDGRSTTAILARIRAGEPGR